jgi:hypothetical protein
MEKTDRTSKISAKKEFFFFTKICICVLYNSTSNFEIYFLSFVILSFVPEKKNISSCLCKMCVCVCVCVCVGVCVCVCCFFHIICCSTSFFFFEKHSKIFLLGNVNIPERREINFLCFDIFQFSFLLFSEIFFFLRLV